MVHTVQGVVLSPGRVMGSEFSPPTTNALSWWATPPRPTLSPSLCLAGLVEQLSDKFPYSVLALSAGSFGCYRTCWTMIALRFRGSMRSAL